MDDSALRAGLYERVSTGIQDTAESRSVDQQNKAGNDAAKGQGWRVVDRYPDPGLSASRFAKRGRPQWSRLVTDIERGRLDVVIMWASNRGGRELEEWARFLNACRKNGVRIFVTNEGRLYDLSIAKDWKSLAEDGIDSAYDSEKISMASRRGVADSVNRGEPTGRIPYGYMRQYEYDPTRSKGKRAIQVPHPDAAPVVREIITRIADGEAVSAIVNDLAARDIPSPTGKARWARGTVCRLVLEGVVYISKRRHNGGPLLDGNWPALVDEAVYWRAVAVLSDPARKPRGGGIRPGRARWLLSYIATCAVCGGPLSVRHVPRAGSGQVAYYRCVRHGCVSAPADLFEGKVATEVMKWCAEPGRWDQLNRQDDAAAASARDEAAAERARLDQFEADAIAGRISAASFARIAAGIEARVAELDERARQLAAPPALSAFWSRSPQHEIAGRRLDFLVRWEEMTVSARRSVVAALVAEPGYLRLEPGHVVDFEFVSEPR